MDSSVKDLKKAILKCGKCPKILESRSRPVPGFGKKEAKIMLVGLAPGKDGADMTGIPFTRDPSGQLLNKMFKVAGISRELDVYITNLVKCNPQDSKGRNRPPSKKEIFSCAPYLKKEIEIINPKLIISLGKSASNYLIDKRSSSMSEIHGEVFKFEGRTVIPFIHPGYVIRGAYDKTRYLNEFEKVGQKYFDLIEQESKMSRFDFILMVLKNAASKSSETEIRGKTRLQKLVFLAQDDLKNRGYSSKYAFRPYYYGPFNRQLYTDIEWLNMNDLIEVKSDFTPMGYISQYKITKKGLEEIQEIIQKNNFYEIEDTINNSLKKYQEYSIGELVEYVHNEYEKYKLKDEKQDTGLQNKKLDEFFIKREI